MPVTCLTVPRCGNRLSEGPATCPWNSSPSSCSSAIFLIATLLPVHMGALALAAAFVVGMFVLDGSTDEKVDELLQRLPR